MASLGAYRKKRKFTETPEPKPKIPTKKNAFRFAVQRHSARHLHYDLRLELEGVLVSFSVPKGPSMNPKVKRLAIHVEDHPLDYLYFEGTIPPGNYGAGEVVLWDHGTYQALANMREGLKKGHLKFHLEGKKLIGTFHLVKINSDADNQWLLFKTDDEISIPKKRPRQKKLPDWFSPMLAKISDHPFDSADWIFEVKWDGFRALAFVDGTKVNLWSRNHKLLNKDFPGIVNDLKQLDTQAIFDGEIVVLDEKGISRFELLQNYSSDESLLGYMIFDLLFINGVDIRALPLLERKKLLKETFHPTEFLHVPDFVTSTGKKLFTEAKKLGLEGLIAKRKSSIYVSRRSGDWLKIKTHQSDDLIVVGFTKPQGQRNYFGSLVLGKMVKGKLTFVGHVGTGFDTKTAKKIFDLMKPLITKECPFLTEPKTGRATTWLKPKLIAEVSYAEITKAKSLRQPVFHGLRMDKEANDKEEEGLKTSSPLAFSPSNVSKLYWPEEGFSKGDMLAYYEEISPYILPHLKDRPLTLHRYPDGIMGADFFQKNIEQPPRWLKTALLSHHHKNGEQNRYPLANDLQSLLYIANLGSIEMHPMLSRIKNLDHPDFLAIDLDPEAVPFSKVLEVALVAHEIFKKLKVPNYCKTSGGRGLHVYLPLGGQISAAESLHLAELIAYILRDRLPKLVSLERSPGMRQRKVYVDYLQNARGKTMIAPYSLRPLPHAPVSTPLKWSEVKPTLDPLAFTMITIPRRLKRVGDLFAPLLEESIDLSKMIDGLEKLMPKRPKN
jgi:bifunctional non-homologous end joining protein LigD